MRTTGAGESGRAAHHDPQEKTESKSRGSARGDPLMNVGKSGTPMFDIFRAESNGSVLWIGSAVSVAEAKALIQESGMRSPGDYLLLDHKTGNRLLIRQDSVNGTPGRIGSQSEKEAQGE